MADREWLNLLKAGDEVEVFGGGQSGAHKAVVTRTTNTQVIVGDARYSMDGGYRRGKNGHLAEWIDRPDLVERRILVEVVRKGLISNGADIVDSSKYF